MNYFIDDPAQKCSRVGKLREFPPIESPRIRSFSSRPSLTAVLS